MNQTIQSIVTGPIPPSAEIFPKMLHGLLYSLATLSVMRESEPPELIQTHASTVIMTADSVYKIKKPKNFGFFDYSTADLRRHFCQLEVELNTPLAPGIYLGVAPILQSEQGKFSFGKIYTPENTPSPGAIETDSTIIDYAVVMKRLPEEATLAARLAAGEISTELISKVAYVIAQIHAQMPTNDHIAQAGSLQVIRKNWHENFVQTRRYIGQTITQRDYTALQNYVAQFMRQHRRLLRQRIRQGYIRDCHGDLRLQHIYILPDANAPAQQQILLLDRIEFNERFRYGDVASDIAFLCMELDAAQRPDLSLAFVQSYIKETGDRDIAQFLAFYCCYRAYVRGKVTSFLLDDPNILPIQREQAEREASRLFQLASQYTRLSLHPRLILVGGIMGTGKSTVARSLQHRYRYPLLATDNIRKELAHLKPTQTQAASFNTGIYTPSWTAQTYTVLQKRALAYLQQGCSIILDATFARRSDRQQIAQVARAHGATVLFIECSCPREVALERLAQRWQKRIENTAEQQQEASLSSDGRPELYAAQAARWETFTAQDEPYVHHIVLSTAGAREETNATVRLVASLIASSEVFIC